MSIIANGGGMPPSQAQIDRRSKSEREKQERRSAHIEAMRERGYHYEFVWNDYPRIWCLTCGLMVGDCDLHSVSSCKQNQRGGSGGGEARDKPAL